MKRLIVPGFCFVAFLVAATTAAAGTSTDLTGSSEWSDQTTTIHGTFDKGTYSGTLTHVPTEPTAECGPVCATVTGTITFSTKHGHFTAVVQAGSFVRLESIASHSWRYFTLDLSVVSGTRSFKHADGDLALSYTSTWSHFVSGTGEVVDTIEDEGTLSGNPRK